MESNPDLDCTMVPIDPTPWVPIVYSSTADESVQAFCEAVNPEHPVLNGKGQHSRVWGRHCDYSLAVLLQQCVSSDSL